MVMVKSFDKYHHLFNVYILVIIFFFHDWDLSTPYIRYFNLINKKDIVQE